MQNEDYLFFNDFYKVYKDDKGVVTCLANNGVTIPIKDMRLNIPKEAYAYFKGEGETKFRLETKFVLRCNGAVSASVYLFSVRLTDEEVKQLGNELETLRKRNEEYLKKYSYLFE